jgi:dienelactone hydrolase
MDSPLGAIGRVTGLGVAIVGSLMVMLVGSAGPAWRSVAAAAVGSVGVVVGLGYGSQRLAEGNLWLGLPIIGAASVSLGVLVIGSYRAIRSTPGWWRLLAIPIAFVLLQFGLMPATFGTLGTHGWRSPVTAAAPAGASTVSVVSLDGVELQAWYLPGRNGAAVVLLPGAGGNRASAVSHALALADLGYGVLAMDARGTGDSGGHNNLWGWEGTKDISAAVSWLDGQPEVRDGRIGLVGLSMGGEQALTAAPEVPGVRAVVSEGVQARGPDDLWYLRDGIRARIERIVAAVQWTVADLWTDASPPPSLRDVATRLGDAPVLIIAADAIDERTVAADLAERAAVVEVWQTSGVGHTGSLAADPDAWSRRVGDFLDRALDQ